MIHLSNSDNTLKKKYVDNLKFLIREYDLVKANKHGQFKFASDFYKHHNLKRQNFLKYYHRFNLSKDIIDLFPRKRGPKWKNNRIAYIENKIIEKRKKGLNRYEIHVVLSPLLKKHLPSPSTIYRICVKHGLGSMNKKMKENKRKIIKEKAGELGHVDCHYLAKELITDKQKRLYLLCVIDSCTRLAWTEVIDDIKSLTVMFATMKCFNLLQTQYDVKFEEMLSDNGSEFGSGPNAKNKETNPFERLLSEMGVKHRYTRPYRPQTNGKVERFWRTLNEDLIDGTDFDSVEEFKQELFEYMIYYNEHRPHSALNGNNPNLFRKNLSSN